MPDSRKKVERDQNQNVHSKSRVVDLKTFKKRRSTKSNRNQSRFGFRSILYGIVVILLSLSLISGILGFFATYWRGQLAIWSTFLACAGLTGGLAMSALADRRSKKLMGLLCFALLIALIAGIMRVGL